MCPKNISKPFLPYRDPAGTLVFPTGRWIGHYYSEELKFAVTQGYKILPLRGYIFEKSDSPFQDFIGDLYESRLEAKKAGNESLSFVYKILMNSLYGRFGINPTSVMTEICSREKMKEYYKQECFISADMLHEDCYVVHLTVNSSQCNEWEWQAPKLSAVHLSAAITACARILMYPFISRGDCYYTDTDSVVLGSPLPDHIVSSSELGKLKLEHTIKHGIFLAPKSYMLVTHDGKTIIKNKGLAKHLMTKETFEAILKDKDYSSEVERVLNFKVSYKELKVMKANYLVRIGMPRSRKREYLFDSNGEWYDTSPRDVVDFGNQDATTLYLVDQYVNMEESERIAHNSLKEPCVYEEALNRVTSK